MGGPGPGPGVATSATRTTFKAEIFFGRSTAPGCVYDETFRFIDCNQVSTVWKPSPRAVSWNGWKYKRAMLSWHLAGKTLHLLTDVQTTLNLMFEVFSNKMAFTFVGPLQPALYHSYNTWKRESSLGTGERMVCMATDEQD